MKIAQRFCSGLSPRTKSSPAGTKENLGRPSGTVAEVRTVNPAINGWAIFKSAVAAKTIRHNKGWTTICRPTTLAIRKEIDRNNAAYSLLGGLAIMGFWTNKVHRTAFDDAENLAYSPSGGRIKMWLLGVGFALIPIGYGVHCLFTGHARFFGRRATHLDLDGSAAIALAIAYIAVGVFIHAHWFWGLLSRFEPVSYLLKLASVLVFLASFGYTIYKIIV